MQQTDDGFRGNDRITAASAIEPCQSNPLLVVAEDAYRRAANRPDIPQHRSIGHLDIHHGVGERIELGRTSASDTFDHRLCLDITIGP
jgi:hypothetical protein